MRWKKYLENRLDPPGDPLIYTLNTIMERQINFKSENDIIVEFHPKWLHHFGYPLKKLNAAESEVDQIFNPENSTRQIEQKLNKLANNLEWYNWGHGPERFLRGHFAIGTWKESTDGRCQVALARDVVEKLRSDLLLLVDLKLTDDVLGVLCVLRESWRPLFDEYNEIGNYEAALNNADPNKIITSAHSGSFQDHELPLTIRAYRDTYQKQVSKFKAGKEGRPKDTRFQLYWKLLFHAYPRLFRLNGLESEKNTILAIGIVIDGCNSYQLVKELQHQLNGTLESKASALSEALYDRLRKPLYKFQEAKWKNPNKNRIEDGRPNRKERIPFHPIFNFLRNVKEKPSANVYELQLSRYICKILDVERHSREQLTDKHLFYFLTKHLRSRPYFQRLGVWPDVLERFYLTHQEKIETSTFWIGTNRKKKGEADLDT